MPILIKIFFYFYKISKKKIFMHQKNVTIELLLILLIT